MPAVPVASLSCWKPVGSTGEQGAASGSGISSSRGSSRGKRVLMTGLPALLTRRHRLQPHGHPSSTGASASLPEAGGLQGIRRVTSFKRIAALLVDSFSKNYKETLTC